MGLAGFHGLLRSRYRARVVKSASRNLVNSETTGCESAGKDRGINSIFQRCGFPPGWR